MTFTEGMLRLVRAGIRVDRGVEAETVAAPAAGPAALPALELPAEAIELSVEEAGLADIEAAVELVAAGVATRIVLSGFPSWPGLLWQAYQLAEGADVLILPSVSGPGGRVDIVIARDATADD